MKYKESIELSNMYATLPGMSLLSKVKATARACRISSEAFRFRGLCAFEIVAQVEKLRGGRGKKDHQKRGRVFHLEKVAGYCGVRLKTFLTDGKIHAIFFTSDVIETTLAHEKSLGFMCGLPRGFFAVAAYTTAPLVAIKIAVNKLREDSSYSIKTFEEDVRHLKRRAKEKAEEQPERQRYLRLPLTADLDAALQELSAHEPFTGKSMEDIAAAAILRVHQKSSVMDAVETISTQASEVEKQEKPLESSGSRRSSKRAKRKDVSKPSLFE